MTVEVNTHMSENGVSLPIRRVAPDASIGSGPRSELTANRLSQKLKQTAQETIDREQKKADINHTPLDLGTIRKNIKMYRRSTGRNDL